MFKVQLSYLVITKTTPKISVQPLLKHKWKEVHLKARPEERRIPLTHSDSHICKQTMACSTNWQQRKSKLAQVRREQPQNPTVKRPTCFHMTSVN